MPQALQQESKLWNKWLVKSGESSSQKIAGEIWGWAVTLKCVKVNGEWGRGTLEMGESLCKWSWWREGEGDEGEQEGGRGHQGKLLSLWSWRRYPVGRGTHIKRAREEGTGTQKRRKWRCRKYVSGEKEAPEVMWRGGGSAGRRGGGEGLQRRVLTLQRAETDLVILRAKLESQSLVPENQSYPYSFFPPCPGQSHYCSGTWNFRLCFGTFRRCTSLGRLCTRWYLKAEQGQHCSWESNE